MCGLHSGSPQTLAVVWSVLHPCCEFSVFTFTNDILIMHLYRISFVLHINFLENFKSWAVSRGGVTVHYTPWVKLGGGVGFTKSLLDFWPWTGHQWPPTGLRQVGQPGKNSDAPKEASTSDNSVMPLFQAAQKNRLSKIEKREDIIYFFSNFDKIHLYTFILPMVYFYS